MQRKLEEHMSFFEIPFEYIKENTIRLVERNDITISRLTYSSYNLYKSDKEFFRAYGLDSLFLELNNYLKLDDLVEFIRLKTNATRAQRNTIEFKYGRLIVNNYVEPFIYYLKTLSYNELVEFMELAREIETFNDNHRRTKLVKEYFDKYY